MAKAVAGAVFFREVDWELYDRPKSRWDTYDVATVLHEVLHQVGLRWGVTDATLPVEEGLVEAVTQDLLPTFTRRLGARYVSPAIAYPVLVRRVRDASEEATGQVWTSPAARRWRVQMLATPPDERTLG